MLDDGAKIFKCHKSIRETLRGFFWRSSSIRLFIYFFIIFGCLKEHFEQFKSSGDLKEETRDASWSLGRGPRWHTISLKTENQTAPFETISNKKDIHITGVRRRTSQSRKKRPKVWEDLQDFEKKVPENRVSTVSLPSFSPIGFPHLEAWTRISCGVHTCVEGCCPIMDLLRSEPMQLVQLIIPVEAAYRTISYLGDLGLFQFKDVSITPQIYYCLDCSWFRVRKFPYCNLGLLIGWWRMKTCDRRRLCVFPLIAEKAGEILENKIAVANKFNSN